LSRPFNISLAGRLVRDAPINGLPGLVLRGEDGAIDRMAFESYDGRITAIYITRNPDELRHGQSIT
jgi:RNA polymerase sigma-70 factor, ECF subfamily